MSETNHGLPGSGTGCSFTVEMHRDGIFIYWQVIEHPTGHDDGMSWPTGPYLALTERGARRAARRIIRRRRESAVTLPVSASRNGGTS